MTVRPINLQWSSRPPAKLEDIATFIAKEGLPIWRKLLADHDEWAEGLIEGFLEIFGVNIRFGSGVPIAVDADGSLYVRVDPPTAATFLYYRFAGAWVLFAGGGGGLDMAAVKRIASLHP